MFTYSAWLALTLPERQALAAKLNISKTGPTHVVNDRVESDGYAIQTVESALMGYAQERSIATPEDLLVALKEEVAPAPEVVPETEPVLEPVEAPVQASVVPVVPAVPTVPVAESAPEPGDEKPKRGRKSKTV